MVIEFLAQRVTHKNLKVIQIPSPRKLKINFILPVASMTGGIRVIAIYANALQNMGHAVTLISIPPRRPKILERIKKLLKMLIRGKILQKNAAPKSHFDTLNLNHRVVEKQRAIVSGDVPDGDVVIATWWETAEWVHRLPPEKGEKFYFIQHHEVFENLPQDRCKATYRLPLKKITIAQWLVDVMREEYGDANVDLVANSVDHAQFFASKRTKQLRPTIGFLYNVAQFKGVDITLAAIAQIKEKTPELRVVCFGSHPPLPNSQLPEYFEVHIDPKQNAIRDIYALCDVWVTCSRSEGFNLPAMEAMACRTPVVSTKAGWPAESVQDGYNGYLLEVDDVRGIANGIHKVLSASAADWQRLSDNAFETVKHSSWEHAAKMFETSLFNSLGQPRL